VSRQVTGDTTNLPNIQYCLRYQRNSGNTSTAVMVISQSMETVNSIRFAGKTVTYSFYARAGANYSGASNALIAYLVSGTGTDQNQRSGYTTQTLPIMQNATLTTTWQRFSFTATVSTAATELAVLLEYVPVGTAGVNDYFEATGFQLEQGAVATPFEFEDFGTTLAKCQRYYLRYSAEAVYTTFSRQAVAYNSINSQVMISPPVSMRVAVSSIDSSNIGLTPYAGTTVTAITSVTTSTEPSKNFISFIANVASGLTTGTSYTLLANNNASAFIGFSAEL
jgi:hypothetical protein